MDPVNSLWKGPSLFFSSAQTIETRWTNGHGGFYTIFKMKDQVLAFILESTVIVLFWCSL